MVDLKTVLSHTSTKRFDAEYFQPVFLADEAILKRRNRAFGHFSDINVRVDASAFYPSIENSYGQGTLPFLRVTDVDEVIDFLRCETIPVELCEKFPTLSRVAPGDLVFTKGGSVARIGFVTEEAAVSRDLIFVTTSNVEPDLAKFLYTYARTDFFRRMLLRSSSQTAQPHLTITLVRHLPIFLPGDALRSAIARVVDLAFAARSESIDLLANAERLLFDAVGLGHWTPFRTLTYVAKSADVIASGRLDAQFFEPKVRQLLTLLSRTGSNVGTIARPRRERFNNENCEVFNYIEISDVDSTGSAGSTTLQCVDAPSRATWHVHSGDVITSTVRPIRRLSAEITPEQEGYVCSSGFLVLRPTHVAPEVLLTFLRLPMICELMDLYASASMYPAVSEADILGLPFPTIGDSTSSMICSAVQRSKQSRGRASWLLSCAKRALEIAIEDDESASLAHLDKAMGE